MKIKAALCRPAVRLPKACCVYGIYQGTELLYIGSTINLRSRIGGHAILATKEMKRTCIVQWIETPVDLLEDREQALIDALRPPHNITLTAKQGHWNRQKYLN